MKRVEKLNKLADHYSRLFQSSRSFHHYELARRYRTEALKAELRAK
jgi:hypothetical protein